MKLVCLGCGKTMEASFIARFEHTLEDPVVKDADGHHIAIFAQRHWCPGPWEEYVSRKSLGGIPFGGGVVCGTEFTLEDGRVFVRDYNSLRDPKVMMCPKDTWGLPGSPVWAG